MNILTHIRDRLYTIEDHDILRKHMQICDDIKSDRLLITFTNSKAADYNKKQL